MTDTLNTSSADPHGGAVEAVDLYFEARAARLRYRDQGRGPAVVMVHGWTLDLDQWNFIAAELARDYRIVRMDRRGFGLSSGEPSIAEDVADVAALCQHLGIEPAAVLGMSQGARVVLQFAASFPGLTSRIIFDGPPQLGKLPVVRSAPDLPYQHYCELARTSGLAAFRDEWSLHPLAQLKTHDPDAHALLARMIGRYPGGDLIQTAQPTSAPAASPQLESLPNPVLIINGEFDLESRRASGKQLASEFPHAEHVVIRGAGHLCCLDNPSTYTDVIRQFLSRSGGFAAKNGNITP